LVRLFSFSADDVDGTIAILFARDPAVLCLIRVISVPSAPV
jgi:hypothetical protein